MRHIDADEILESLGLARKSQQTSWLWPALGGLGLGLLCGVAIGAAYAPKKGSELREELGGKIKNRDYAGIAETARGAINAQTSHTGRGTGI